MDKRHAVDMASPRHVPEAITVNDTEMVHTQALADANQVASHQRLIGRDAFQPFAELLVFEQVGQQGRVLMETAVVEADAGSFLQLLYRQPTRAIDSADKCNAVHLPL